MTNPVLFPCWPRQYLGILTSLRFYKGFQVANRAFSNVFDVFMVAKIVDIIVRKLYRKPVETLSAGGDL